MEVGSSGGAQIQVEPVPARKGFKFRVYLNKTIQGTWSEHIDKAIESGSGPDQPAETDDKASA